MTSLRRALVASSIAWAAVLPLAPYAASQPGSARAWYALAFFVYGAGSVVCHQLPERSFVLWSAQWPVCARCTGIYVGAAVAAIYATIRRKKVRLPPSPLRGIGAPRKPDASYARVMLVAGVVPTALTLAYEWVTGNMPSNAIRALSGVPLGAAIVFVIIHALQQPQAGARP